MLSAALQLVAVFALFSGSGAALAGKSAFPTVSPPRVWGQPLGRVPEPARETGLAELGRHLFFDPRLSINGCKSCASCHQPALAFTDGLPKAIGVYGDAHGRNTPTLANVAYAASFTASDAGIETLEAQSLVPLLNTAPPEMGLTKESLPGVLARFDGDPRYRDLLAQAFPDTQQRLTLEAVQSGLAAFQRTLVSFESPFDRYVYFGDDKAMSPEALRGMQLFFSRRLACAACHSGWNYSGPVRTAAAAQPSQPAATATRAATAVSAAVPAAVVTQRFHNMGSSTDSTDGVTEFKAPTLRNIALTAPYMHDGSLATLDAVIQHYENGGGEGKNKSSLLRKFTLSTQERADLIEFLKQLTDSRFVERSRISPTFEAPSPQCGRVGGRDQASADSVTDSQ